MLYDYWNYTSCINNGQQLLIEASLVNIVEEEGFTRIYELPKNFSVDELDINYHKFNKQLLKQLWIVGLFPGVSGWIIIKTKANKFMCRRAINSKKPRLSEVAVMLYFQPSEYYQQLSYLSEIAAKY